MIELVVVRRSAEDARGLVGALKAGFPGLLDIHRWDQVQLVRVDSNAQVTAFVDGHPLDDVGAVLVLGAPWSGKATLTRDEQYTQQEREQALLAALAACVHVKVINRPAVLLWNHALADPGAQLRRLAALGWSVPIVTRSFDLETGAVSKLRDPEPDPRDLDLIVIGQRRHARASSRPAHPALAELVARTQLHLRETNLDLVTLPIADRAAGPVAYGWHAGPSLDIPGESLHHLIREAMQ